MELLGQEAESEEILGLSLGVPMYNSSHFTEAMADRRLWSAGDEDPGSSNIWAVRLA